MGRAIRQEGGGRECMKAREGSKSLGVALEWNLGRLPLQVCQAGGFHSVKGRRAYNVSCQRLSKILVLLVKPALGFNCLSLCVFFWQVCLVLACLGRLLQLLLLNLLWLLLAPVVAVVAVIARLQGLVLLLLLTKISALQFLVCFLSLVNSFLAYLFF